MSIKIPDHGWGTRTIDAYEKIKCVGAGTYGQVYKAKNKVTEEIVALKKIRTLNEAHGLPLTTIREIKLLRYFRHRNLVGLIEIAASTEADEDEESTEEPDCVARFTSGALYLVLEYVEHDLTGLIDKQYVFTEIIMQVLLQQLLEVVHHLHINGFLHRDIKCSNLLLTNQHILKLADFGLSRSIEGEQDYTNKVVTLWYRPPELLLGATEYTASVDMWSVGCVFAELLLGQPLFPGKTEVEQIGRIFDICGSPTLENWPGHEVLRYSEKFVPKVPKPSYLRQHITRSMEKAGRQIPTGAIDLLVDLLQLNPRDRITAEGALRSKFFSCAKYIPPPEMLPPISSITDSHEYETKKLRRDAAKMESGIEAKRRRTSTGNNIDDSRHTGEDQSARLRRKMQQY